MHRGPGSVSSTTKVLLSVRCIKSFIISFFSLNWLWKGYINPYVDEKDLGKSNTILALGINRACVSHLVISSKVLLSHFSRLTAFGKGINPYVDENDLLQTMTEAAIFKIGRSRTIRYGKIWPLADYRRICLTCSIFLHDLHF